MLGKLTVASICLIAAGIVRAELINVPADQPTIQAAIDSAIDDDVVLVAPGTYVENLAFAGKNITVESADGPATTVIDGGGVDSTVRFSQGETRTAVLRGFTITNGNANEGGGIVILSTSPTIEDNIVTGNHSQSGAGIGMAFAAPLIIKNVINGNSPVPFSGGGLGGGGISIRGASQAEIYDNVIANNGSSDGAGLSLFAADAPIILRNEIRGNIASGEGGAIKMVNAANVLIYNNLIYNNDANEGAAFYWSIPASTPIIRFNTMFNNSTTQPSSATMHIDGFDNTGVISSNIISAPNGEAAFFCGNTNDPGFPLIEANNVVAEGGTLYTGICPDQTGMRGNVSVAPQFADSANGDFRLVAGSPMLDAGIENAAVQDDFFSNPRPVDGNDDTIAMSDIGALEAAPPVANAGIDITVDANGSVTLDGLASDDQDGAVVDFQWAQIGGDAVDLVDESTAVATFVARNVAATLSFSLTVTDDLGYQASDDVTVTVLEPPPLPPLPPSPPPPRQGSGGGGNTGLHILLLMSALWLIRRIKKR